MGQVWGLDPRHDQMLVMLALSDHAHDDGTRCYPGVDYLAWKTGYERRSVQRALRGLERAHLIQTVSGERGGRGRAREYRIVIDNGVKKTPYVSPKGRHSPHETVASTTPNGGARATPTVPNHQEPARASAAPRAPLCTECGHPYFMHVRMDGQARCASYCRCQRYIERAGNPLPLRGAPPVSGRTGGDSASLGVRP